MSGSLNGTCSGSAPIAYWTSHGTNDTTITPAAGQTAREQFRIRNGCGTTTTAGDRAGCVEYAGCSAGHPTVSCTFDGAHVPAPYAGEAIWRFFSRF
jgi:hypothetical protein